MEKKIRHYEFEGAAWTAEGFSIMHSVEDGCSHGEWDESSRCRTCGECKYFVSIGQHSPVGVCRQKKRLRTNIMRMVKGGENNGN